MKGRRRNLTLLIEAAEQLGTDRHTIRGLVKALGIVTHKTGMPGRARGLDSEGMRRLGIALDRTTVQTA
jgi:hypothetical protein